MSTNEIILLLASGIIVGIINTLGGGGSVITMSLFMAMGMPVGVANGTNRIAVVLQNLSATVSFMRKRMVDYRSSLLLSSWSASFILQVISEHLIYSFCSISR